MNVDLLKYYIELRGMNLTQLAELQGVSRSCLYAKMRKPDNLSLSDIKLIIQNLELAPDEISNIFFSESLPKSNDNE